jgi:hypothetical protein
MIPIAKSGDNVTDSSTRPGNPGFKHAPLRVNEGDLRYGCTKPFDKNVEMGSEYSPLGVTRKLTATLRAPP